MKSHLAIAIAALLAGGCLVVPIQGAKKAHPHGGPPGQMKAKHHGHRGDCGHKRMQHGAVWVYSVNGQWYKAKGPDWVVVAVDDNPGAKGSKKAKKAKKDKKE